jgi:hypothetical protein
MEGLRVLIYPFLSLVENPQIRNVKHLKFKVVISKELINEANQKKSIKNENAS